MRVSIRVGQSSAQDARRDHAGLRAATCQVCCVRQCTNTRTGTASMMRVERVDVALLLLVSQGARLAVIAMAGERSKGSESLAGSHLPDPGSRTDKRRKVATANENYMRWSSMGFTG